MKTILEILAKTANQLDKVGESPFANRVDNLIQSLAEEEVSTKDERPPLVKKDVDPAEEEVLEEMPATVNRLRELRDVLPEPPDSTDQSSNEAYQEEVDKRLREEMEIEEEIGEQYQVMGPTDKLTEDQKNLYENDLIPVTNKGSSKIGEGYFSQVHHALWNNKDVAAKVTRVQEHGEAYNDEAQVWSEILDIKDYLSEDTQRHLPEIYKIIPETSTGEQIVVMELLEPPDPHVMEYVWKFDPAAKSRVKITFDHFMKGTGWMEKAYEYIYSVLYYDLDKLTNPVRNLLFKSLFSFKPTALMKDPGRDDYSRNQGLRREIKEHMHKEFFAEYKDTISTEKTNNFSDLINSVVNAFLSHMRVYESSSFPRSFREIDALGRVVDMLEDFPESQSFLRALMELSEHGISWRDLHQENVMQRPKTKELVIIDVGLYDTPIKGDVYDSDPSQEFSDFEGVPFGELDRYQETQGE
jgi:hypothetical protein